MPESALWVTEAGLRRLEEELNALRSYRRQEIVDEMRRAKECGDLDGEEDVDSSISGPCYVDQRISRLQEVLQVAMPVIASEIPTAYVGLGSQVVLEEIETGEAWEVRVVSAAEADPCRDWISDECPVGAALMGRRAGDSIAVDAPAGQLDYRVVSISRPHD